MINRVNNFVETLHTIIVLIILYVNYFAMVHLGVSAKTWTLSIIAHYFGCVLLMHIDDFKTKNNSVRIIKWLAYSKIMSCLVTFILTYKLVHFPMIFLAALLEGDIPYSKPVN